MALVELRNVVKDYDTDGQKVRALDGISLSVGAGELVALVGRSGCGKSTLLNLAGAMDFASSGEVRIDGQTSSAASEGALTRLRREKVGFVFQSFQLLHTLSAVENVELPLLLSRRNRARELALERMGDVGLDGLENRLPHQLSGGQMQRVAIARALVHSPKVLLADEPTGNLDEDTRDEIIVLLETMWRERGLTMVFVTHDSTVARRAQRIGVMKNGRLGFKQSRLGPAPRVQAEPAQVPERSGLQPPDLPDLSDLEDDDSEPADTITFD